MEDGFAGFVVDRDSRFSSLWDYILFGFMLCLALDRVGIGDLET